MGRFFDKKNAGFYFFEDDFQLIKNSVLQTDYIRDIASRVRETYGSKISIFENVIPLSVKVAEASAEGKDVLLVFPSQHKNNTTVQILKTPKTESSIRKVFLLKSVANMLVEWKVEQDEVKEVLGEEYIDYNLVMATTFGNPIGAGAIRGQLNKLIEEHNLPPVVFHSLRHSSVTYKLKLNGGDIKAVQGDSGHSQVDMVTDVYPHIIDEDRRRNAELLEEAFYEKKNLDPKMRDETATQTVDVPDDVDAELLAKVLANPEMKALLASLAKAMK